MKRLLLLSMCFVFLFVLLGCNSTEIDSGFYYMVGDCEEHVTPYVQLNFDDNIFAFGEGRIISYAERGSFTIKGDRLTATTQNTTFTFEIKDSSSIILIDCGEYEAFAEYVGSEFAYHVDT